jgi:hypothetical protein
MSVIKWNVFLDSELRLELKNGETGRLIVSNGLQMIDAVWASIVVIWYIKLSDYPRRNCNPAAWGLFSQDTAKERMSNVLGCKRRSGDSKKCSHSAVDVDDKEKYLPTPLPGAT